MVLSTAARRIKSRSKPGGRVVVRGGRVVSGSVSTIRERLNKARAAKLTEDINVRKIPIKSLIALSKSLGVKFDPKLSRKVLEKNILLKSQSILNKKKQSKKPGVETVDISKIKVEGQSRQKLKPSRQKDIIISKTQIPFRKPKDTKTTKKEILRQQLMISGAEAGLRAIKVGKRKNLYGRVIDRLVNDIEKRRQESIRASRDIARIEASGKRLTGRQKAAKVAAGLQNVGIEFIAGLTSLPVMVARPRRTINSLKRAVLNPRQTLSSIATEIKKNPSGFIAGFVGATQGFNQLGKLTKFTVRTTGKTLKYTARGTLAAADGTIKLTKTGAKGAIKIIGKGGKKILEKTRNFKIGKAAKLAKKSAKATRVKNLASEVDSITRSVSSLKKLIKGKKAIPKQLTEQIAKLEKRRISLIKKIGKNPKALTQDGLIKAEQQALRLKKLLEKKTFKKQDILRRAKIEKSLKNKKILKREKIRRRREKATQIKQDGKVGRKRAKDPFRKRELIKEIKRLKNQAKSKKGQQTFNDVRKTVEAANKVDRLRNNAAINNLKYQANIKNFFNKMNNKVGKNFKKGSLKGCR